MAAIAVSVLRGSTTTIGRLVAVAADPLPHDGVGDAEVRADQHDDVGLLEVRVGVRRRVEAEGLLVGRDRGGHALAGVAVAVDHAHAELGQRAQQRHLLGDDLAGAQQGHDVGAVLVLDRLEARGPGCRCATVQETGSSLPRRLRSSGTVARSATAAASAPPSPWGRPCRGSRVVGAGAQVDRRPVLEVHVRGRSRSSRSRTPRWWSGRAQPGGHLAQAETPGRQQQLAGERTVRRRAASRQQVAEAASRLIASAPGMREAGAAWKNSRARAARPRAGSQDDRPAPPGDAPRPGRHPARAARAGSSSPPSRAAQKAGHGRSAAVAHHEPGDPLGDGVLPVRAGGATPPPRPASFARRSPASADQQQRRAGAPARLGACASEAGADLDQRVGGGQTEQRRGAEELRTPVPGPAQWARRVAA